MPFIGEPADSDFPLTLTPESELIGKEEYMGLREKLNHAITQLTPRQREALYLKYIEGFSYAQVSEMMNLTSKATYKLMARAIVAIKDQMTGFILIFFIDELLSGHLI